MRRFLPILFAAACTHQVRPDPAALPPAPLPLRTAASGTVGLTGEDIARALEESGVEHETLEPGRRWMAAFAGRRLPRVVLYVVRGDDFTVIMGKLFTVSDKTSTAFYRALARRNFDYDQMKFSLDAGGGVFASFEVPTRLLDRRELLENLFGLAVAIDTMLPELLRDAGFGDAPDAPAPEPAPRTEPPSHLEAALP